VPLSQGSWPSTYRWFQFSWSSGRSGLSVVISSSSSMRVKPTTCKPGTARSIPGMLVSSREEGRSALVSRVRRASSARVVRSLPAWCNVFPMSYGSGVVSGCPCAAFSPCWRALQRTGAGSSVKCQVLPPGASCPAPLRPFLTGALTRGATARRLTPLEASVCDLRHTSLSAALPRCSSWRWSRFGPGSATCTRMTTRRSVTNTEPGMVTADCATTTRARTSLPPPTECPCQRRSPGHVAPVPAARLHCARHGTLVPAVLRRVQPSRQGQARLHREPRSSPFEDMQPTHPVNQHL
jgi:hypothetical protein